VQRGTLEVWTRTLADKRTAVALFNRGADPARIEASLAELGLGGISGPVAAIDVWGERSLGKLDGNVAADVESHGVVLLVLEAVAAPS
jgi:alpha-galactosidase